MTNFRTKTGLSIEIRYAKNEDIPCILELNKKWTVMRTENIEKDSGFLFCETYKYDDIELIISKRELAIGLYEGKLIGYYLNDSFSDLITQHKSAINFLKSNGYIKNNIKVSFRTQIVVEKEFQRNRIPEAMLNFLKPHLKNRYDLLLSIGKHINPKRVAHEKAGWKTIYEDGVNYFCIYDLRQ